MKKTILLLMVVVSLLVVPDVLAKQHRRHPLNFEILPGTETVELHLGQPEMKECIRMDFSIPKGEEKVPYELDVFLQGDVNSRWAYNVVTLLPEKDRAVEYTALIHVDELQLKDPKTGRLDPDNLYPADLQATDLGVYFWDGDDKKGTATVTLLEMSPCKLISFE